MAIVTGGTRERKFGRIVNAIAPGYVDSDMVAAVPAGILAGIVAKIPVGRLGTAHDIARGVTFVCADDADFVTGSTLTINGSACMHSARLLGAAPAVAPAVRPAAK